MSKKLFKLLFCIEIIFFIGCSKDSALKFRKEGQRVSIELAKELETIHSYEDLVSHESQLGKKMEALIDLMIEAKKWSLKHPKEALSHQENLDRLASDRLLFEFLRVGEIEGAKSFLVHLQSNSLHRLDRFDSQVKKRTPHMH